MDQKDNRWRDLKDKVAGRRRVSLWRAEKDWYATGGIERTGKSVEKEMMQQVKAVRRLDSTMTNDGWTTSRNMKKIGSIPFYIMLAHPELWHDDKALDRFLKDNPKWKVGY